MGYGSYASFGSSSSGSNIHGSGYGNHSSSGKSASNDSKSCKTMGSGSRASNGSGKSGKLDGDHHGGYHLFSHKANKSTSAKGGKRVRRLQKKSASFHLGHGTII